MNQHLDPRADLIDDTAEWTALLSTQYARDADDPAQQRRKPTSRATNAIREIREFLAQPPVTGCRCFRLPRNLLLDLGEGFCRCRALLNHDPIARQNARVAL